jgi:glycerol-3-phosphate acyltransferase PlsX
MARIAVDAMGGDFAPREIVAGTIEAAASVSHIEQIFLVGDETKIRAELDRAPTPLPDWIEVVHATEVVGMEESPATAVRRKKDSSIGRAVDLVKEGRAQAIFSAGNTGAAVAATTLKLRMLEGIERPAIATAFPTPRNPFVLLDAGATPDCTPSMLVQFAVMGVIHAQEVLKTENPRVGLMNIGEEDAKGNEVTKEAFRLLEKTHLNFIGNVESRDPFEGRVDVVVCDGFVGNVVLKTSEAVAKAVGGWVRDEVKTRLVYQLGALLMKGAFASIRERSDPAAYGGAPLMGVNGCCVIGHGSSKAKAVKNGISYAASSVAHEVNPRIVAEVRKISNEVQGE